MKRTIILTGVALLFCTGLFVQTADQSADQLKTRKRDQLQIHNQTGTGDKIRKKDQLRIHDRTHLKSRDQTAQVSMAKNMNRSQVRSESKNCVAGVNASQRNVMRMNNGVRAGRR